MDKKQVAEILEEIADILELKGEVEFKVRAYRNAARIIRDVKGDLKELVDSGDLAKIKGIGPNLFEKIKELVNTGQLKYYEELKKSIPEGLFELLQIRGLGPKRIKAIYEKLGITTLAELEYACRENRLLKLEGFGKTIQDKVLKEIERLKRSSEYHLISFIFPIVKAIEDFVNSNLDVIDFTITGSWRRRKEIIRDIDVVLNLKQKNFNRTIEAIQKNFPHTKILKSDDNFISLHSEFGVSVDFILSDEDYAFKVFYTTGSKEFLEKFGKHIGKLGFELKDDGIYKNADKIDFSNEVEIFEKFKMKFIPPEIREGFDEIELALNGEIPELIQEKDLLGVFHIHSTYSDGSDTLEDMIAECEKLGFKFVGISDHSKSAYYAGGLTEDRLIQQWKEIDELQKKFKIKILKGAEVDILPDGSLDYSDEILSKFDFVIASIHSKFRMTEEEATNRIIKAMQNPYVTILGHPTGRLLLGRDGYPVDMKKIIDEASKLGVAIEFNANPHRLDIDWRFINYARSKGVKISINPDAHAIGEIYYTILSLGTARKGMLTKQDVLNAMNVSEVQNFLKTHRLKK
ncbi:DNA polymerase/3'-5' exonuclease PolX [Candidatus Chrysopegis kryptomonas]|uniref:DNA polymerase beta n=1 Tax=Candidatus Chryseopegocella kryptomonas TaxID=1633643 RepID=A0A0P1MWE4_9BACT|nr:DNA polymerase/3'-5' exonuclease PolX [Candidatus Chrysopegis kryptomonas]CUT00282.1 DNA polymerase (family 10) [Candidatus Chrysopegis kryptomonas]